MKRRKFLESSAMFLCGGLVAQSTPLSAAPAPAEGGPPEAGGPASRLAGLGLSVKEFGAVGDATHDDTQAIRAAIAAAASGRGATVSFPPGAYLITDTIQVPTYVSLVGSPGVPAKDTAKGVSLLITTGKGSTEKPAFVLASDTSMSGFCMVWPEQVAPDSKSPPIPFGWAIATDTTKDHNIDDVRLENLLLLNPYLGIRLDKAGRFYLNNIRGQPLSKGIYIDRVLDVARMQNVHLWPFYAPGRSPLGDWVQNNGVAFEMRRIDMVSAIGCFCYGYAVGWLFDANEEGGAPWADLVNCAADICNQAISINKSNMIRFHGGSWTTPHPTGSPCLVTGPDVGGSVQFLGGSFYGAAVGAAISSKSGSFVFNGVDFRPSAHPAGNGLRLAPIVVSGAAPVQLAGCSGVEGEMPLGRDNVEINGVPLPQASADITPPGFDFSEWKGGKPTGWLLDGAPPADVAPVQGGVQLSLQPGGGEASKHIDFPVPPEISAEADFHVLTFELSVQATGAQRDRYRLSIRECRSDGAGTTAQFRIATGYTGSDLNVSFPAYFGKTSGSRVIRIEWQAQGQIGGHIRILNLKWHKSAPGSIAAWQLHTLAGGRYPQLCANPSSVPAAAAITGAAGGATASEAKAYTVGSLPPPGSPGRIAFASNGHRPTGGLGVMVYDDGRAWRTFDGAPVKA